MKRAILTCAAALLALTACGKKTETAASAGGAAAPATATAPVTSAGPLTPPSRKSGLWEQTVSSDRMKQTIKMCLDAATEQKMKWWGSAEAGRSSNCDEQRVTPHLGGGWEFHSVCKMGESGVVTSDGSMSGDFGSHYVVAVKSVTTGSPMPQANGPHSITIEATWAGPCPADMKPGDMEMPGGLKMNLASGGAPGANSSTAIVLKHNYSAADIAQMRAQAKAMAEAMKDQQK